MRVLLLISLSLSLVVFSGCSTIFGKYDYSVAVKNIGTKKIWVEDFKLYESNHFASVITGTLIPNAESTCGPYNKKPYSSVKIWWRFMEGNDPCGKFFEQTVKINLPEEFTQEHYEVAIIYIDPDKNKMYISYRITLGVNKYKEINSDGTPFILPQRTTENQLPKKQ